MTYRGLKLFFRNSKFAIYGGVELAGSPIKAHKAVASALLTDSRLGNSDDARTKPERRQDAEALMDQFSVRARKVLAHGTTKLMTFSTVLTKPDKDK